VPSTATVFHDSSERGNHVTLTLADNERYALKHLSELSPSALAFAISSVSLSRKGSNGEELSLYLFTGNTQIPPWDNRRMIPYVLLNLRAAMPFIEDFHGDFLRLTLPGGHSGAFNVDDLTIAAFNDKTTSLMLVNRFRNGKREKTVSARATFTAPWDAAFMGLIPVMQLLLGGGVGISRVQDPVFSWLAFPAASQSLPTNFTYMTVSQWFTFNSWGIGVNAWLMFYLRLALDSSGKVEVNVVDMDRYVWPGTGQGEMYQAIDGAKGGIISALQSVSSLILGLVTGTTCDDIYLLPGTQPNSIAAGNASAHGNALDDVTIVLENPR
jgi:hypothetical protein